jgi:hypothetical protein
MPIPVQISLAADVYLDVCDVIHSLLSGSLFTIRRLSSLATRSLQRSNYHRSLLLRLLLHPPRGQKKPRPNRTLLHGRDYRKCLDTPVFLGKGSSAVVKSLL